MTDALWQLGGWTMIHFLWLGTGVALVGATLRFAWRRAAPSVRYAVSLLTLAALAALPVAIAAWLSVYGPGISPQRVARGDLSGRPNPVTPRYSEGSGSPLKSPSALQNTPNQDGLSADSQPQVIDLAVTPVEPAAPQTMAPAANPSPSPSAPQPLFDLQGRGVSVAAIVAWLPWLWLIGAPLTFALLASGLVGSERLRRKCTALTDGPAAAACEQLRQAMRITRRVSVAVCDKIAQPVLIGILRPLILLPASALSGWTPAELEMVLVHELAHVRRWDNLVNLLQRIIESALFFHPAVWLVSRQVRRDREECCDTVVVARIERPHDYAALLVSIAAKMQSRRPAALAAASAMADHPLTGRIRRILKLEDEPMWISRRTLGLTLVLPLLLIAAVIYSGAAAENPPPSKGGARGGIENAKQSIEVQKLQADVSSPVYQSDIQKKLLQSLIESTEKRRADLEVLRQVSRQSGNPMVGTIERAIADAFEDDPYIAEAQKTLADLQNKINEQRKRTRNPNDPELKAITAKYQDAEQQFAIYRARIEKAARDQVKEILTKDELRPQDSAYQYQLDSLTKSLERYRARLKALDGTEAGEIHPSGKDDRAIDLHTSSLPSADSETEALYSARGYIDPKVELPRLTAEIRRLEDQIDKTKKDLVNIEIFKQLATDKARSPAVVEKAIAASLDKDPTIANYQQKLYELQEMIQGHTEEFKKLDEVQRKQKFEEAEQIAEQMSQYRAATEKAAREQIAKMPNEAYRAAIVEHRIRYEAATANLKKYQQELSEANRKLAELTLASSAPQSAFPSLEDQKIADRAYKLLGWELEPLTADELAIAKQHGYDGGLRIEGSNRWQPGVVANGMPVYGDILVGLHTWPVRNLKDLDEILVRNDLRQLTPLKFYVVSRFLDRGNQDAWTANEGNWSLMKGRVEIDQQWLAEIEAYARDREFNAMREESDQELAQMEELAPAVIPVVVTVKQPPISKGDSTTALLKLGMVWNADNTPQQFERAWKQQLALVRSTTVISQAIKLGHGKLKRDYEARLANRFRASFPGDGEIMKLELTADETTPDNDPALLQAIIDAYSQLTLQQAKASGAPQPADVAQDTATHAPGDAPNDLAPALILDPVTGQRRPAKEPWEVEFAAAQSAADKNGKFILIYFYSPDSTACDEFEKQVLDDPESRAAIDRDYELMRVDVNKVPSLAENNRIKAIPAVAVISPNATTSFKCHDRDDFLQELKQVREKFSQPVASAPPIYLYDGKPFDEWRSLWKHELNTERRTEAIEALAAFARAGYGKESAATILDVAGEYDFRSYDESPEGKLRERVAQVLTLGKASRVPAPDWLPALLDRLAKDPDKWRPLMARLMSGGVPETDYTLDPATRKLLLQIASEPKYGPNAAALNSLYSRNYTDKGEPVSDPEVASLIKAALAGEDVANALAVLRMLSFGSLDDFLEQLDFLFHQDAAARRTARTILRGGRSQSREAVADRLIAILDDPKRADDHADAIRALGVLARPLSNQIAGRHESWPDEAKLKELNKRFEQIAREGSPELVAPALVAMGIDGVNAIDGGFKHGLPGESEEYKERIKQARDKIEAEMEQLVDPPNFGGGGGGGLF